jgi:hypothetical protein
MRPLWQISEHLVSKSVSDKGLVIKTLNLREYCFEEGFGKVGYSEKGKE